MPELTPGKALLILFMFFFSFWAFSPAMAAEGEKTYDITLTKTSGLKEGEIHKVGRKKVLASPYVVAEGEHLWQIMRKKRLLKMGKMGEILSVLKELNPALRNLDLIQPGQRLLIPLKIVPISGMGRLVPVVEKMTTLAGLKDLKIDNYTVQAGDALTRVIAGRYAVPPKALYGDYLALVRKLNPNIRDLNRILPGQHIKLPIYSPEMVRKPIIPERFQKAEKTAPKEKTNPLGQDLARIFREMGQEWIGTGEHFIPLSTGGQINLRAESFPLLNLSTGRRVIVDLNNGIPSQVVDLIRSSWGTYQVVHLTKADDLRSALNKIFKACDFVKVYGPGEPLSIGGDIPLRMTGDWIITMRRDPDDKRPGTVVLTLRQDNTPSVPWMIRDYLEKLGIKVIDYPSVERMKGEEQSEPSPIRAPDNPEKLVEMVLNRLGRKFSRSQAIPVYESKSAGVELMIKADLYLTSDGQDRIIDFSGLGPKILTFLGEHQFKILSLNKKEAPKKVLLKTLDFLDIPHKSGPHVFLASRRDAARNIRITLSGVSFQDEKGESILASDTPLPKEMVSFLSRKGYEILALHAGVPGASE
ncbi:MAG: LysM domain-containing protein [Desulfatiglandaceae bacterium]